MNAEFNWWLLIVGLVVGAGLVWLVIADWSRREEDLTQEELSTESAWIAQTLRDRGEAIDPAAAEEVLALHRFYLRATAGGSAEPTDEDDADWTDEPMAGDEPERPAEGLDLPTDRPGALAADRAPDLAADASAPDRPSVRATRLSPRGGPGSLESEPPA